MKVLVKRPSVHKRASHPKSRKGCSVCKIRRIKCGEERPSCLRCLKSGFECEYPRPKIPKSHEIRRTPAILLPKSHNIRVVAALPKQPSQSRFLTDEESRYFDVFCNSTAYEIFPNVEMGRLRSMFLQTCESMPSIRHAIIALGALDMTSQARQGHLARDRYGKSPADHYQLAIKEYDRAIKHARVEGEDKDLRTALVTSLAIMSFEGWIGNHAAAIQQIKIGTRLLKEWKERYLERSVSGYSIPPNEEENILSHVFTRLSIQLRSPPPRQPTAPSSTPLPPLHIPTPPLFTRMPKSFTTLAEAGIFYSAIVRFAVQFVSQALPLIARSSNSLTETYTLSPTISRSSSIPTEIALAQSTLTTALHNWMSAFTALKSNIPTSQSLHERKAALTLELQMKATYMGTVKSLAQDEMVFDEYENIYADIISLSESLLKLSSSPNNSGQRTPKFSFDSSVIIPLWFTGHKCRSPALRQKTIALLLTYPRREGVWDSVFAGLVLNCLRNFEEEFLDENGKVPKWARIRNTQLEVDLERRVVEVRCWQRECEDGEVRVRRGRVDYFVGVGVRLEELWGVWYGKVRGELGFAG